MKKNKYSALRNGVFFFSERGYRMLLEAAIGLLVATKLMKKGGGFWRHPESCAGFRVSPKTLKNVVQK